MIEIKIKSTIKRAAIETGVTAGLALALLGIATELIKEGVWHNTLLLISGVLLGAFAFYYVLLTSLLKARREGTQKETLDDTP